MEKKKKNRSHRYDINRPRSRHRHKDRKHIKCLIMIMLIGTKQHLNNIWGSIHKKVKQHWGWVEKSVAYQKNVQGLFYIKVKKYEILHRFVPIILKKSLPESI